MPKYAYNRLVVRKSYPNFWQSLDTPTLPFLHNFECDFVRMDPMNVQAKFEVRSFTRSWDNSEYLKLCAVPGYAVQGHPRWLILVPIESAYMTSY